MSYYQFPTQSSSSPSPSPYSSFPMSVSGGIQGQLLEVTVVGCNKLKDTEWISRQDPYVCVEYANSKHRTRTHTDGGRNPTFQEKFVIPLIEGLREMNVAVWNSNSVTYDDFIGEGKVHLQKVLSQGYDDGTWPLQTKTGRYAGEVRLIMHYLKPNISAKPNKPAAGYAPSAPPYGAPPAPQAHMYSTAPPASAYAPPPQMYAPPPPAAYPAPSPYPSYSPTPSYPPNPAPAAYPPNPAPGGYPPSPYGAPPPAAYPPAPYPPSSTYPPPPSSTYPPPPQASSFYPPPQGPYGVYPPPPY
ncbi:proline-rich extensin-like protein EPR1 isoform X2 [Rosa rugosa]|uniref:proline-rich extensin-like protein EPR1 isoform X2 n=1 Tax=Rosa rugosa TaxID=74645 RepID=UPI002B4163F6|nr:proline-rich extensin-like protein EPR1 isoform X2 [Rosa rugosa]